MICTKCGETFEADLGGAKDTTDEEGVIIGVSQLKYLRAVLAGVAWGFLIAILFTSSNIAYLYLETKMMGNLLFALFRVMMVLTLPMIIVWFIWIFVKIAQDREMKEMISRGVQLRSNLP